MSAPDPKVDLADAPQASLRDVFRFARTRKVRLCLAGSFLAACVSGATLPALAFFFAKAFEDLARSTASDAFTSSVRSICIAFMALGVIIGVSMTVQATLQETAAWEMTKDLKKGWFRALLRQDMAYHDLQDVAGQASIIHANGNIFRKGVGRKLSEAVQFTITFVGGLGYALYASWTVTLAVLASVPLLGFSIYYSIQLVSAETTRRNEIYAKAGAIVIRTVSNIRTVLSLNAVQRMVDEYRDATEEAMRGCIRNSWLIGLSTGAVYATSNVAYIIVTLLGGWLLYTQVRNDGCDPSGTVEGVPSCNPDGMDIMGALMGVSFAAGILPQVSVAMQALSSARAACYPALVAMSRRLKTDKPEDPDLDLEKQDMENRQSAKKRPVNGSVYIDDKLPEYVIDSSSDAGLKPTNVKGDIEFHNVTFAFPARKDSNVLVDFSLRVEAGMTVALVGASGSGKSTVVSLIERFYDPCHGSVTLGGVDLKQLNVRWLREQIGLVLQEPKLFAKSIKENIAMGRPGASMEDIEVAAKAANAYDFIMSFPNGFDTQVGDLGAQLSGGQRQRIAIARVLVKQPKILLLDEATSALDSESEATVQAALDNLLGLKNMTTLVIAHRLSTIRDADLIVVMKHGQVAEMGTHAGLLAKKADYFHLVEAQKTKQHVDADEKSDKVGYFSQPSDVVSVSPFDETVDSEFGRTVAIRFSNVSFRYPARPETLVLRNLSLTVYEGETLAIVGASGSGKSTIIQLVENFYRPEEGVVEYYGEDLKNICVRWLRDELGLVSQEATLFDGTIADNIKFGCPDATHEQVLEAAKQANCHNFITDFPDGYKTSVKDGGILVSGGQKQRIAIARALIKKPKVLLLDEATSALDSASEKIVQAALEKIMSLKEQTCIVIAHRLSTVRNADRIAVIDNGTLAEIGTHDELMARSDGKYRKLQAMQDLSARASKIQRGVDPNTVVETKLPGAKVQSQSVDEVDFKVSKEETAANGKRAWLMGSSDWPYLAVGTAGALLSGLNFPSMGWVFAYMIELLYQPVLSCENAAIYLGFQDCEEYHDDVADDMRHKSLVLTYAYIGLIVVSLVGLSVTFWGFGSAAEKMNKRVRDAAFTSIVRQEVGWHDLNPPGQISSQLANDTSLLQAFAGEPIRTLVLSMSSVLVGAIIAFVYMWPFALLILFIIPFLGIGAAIEMKTYMGNDEGLDKAPDENSPGGVVIEALSNIRTVASLTLEEQQACEYGKALDREDPHPIRTNLIKGSASGLGQLIQMFSMSLMFFWGSFLMSHYSESFSYRSFLIAMFALFMSMYGIAIAVQGAVDKDKAKQAAARIFAIIDRESEIDPLSSKGETIF